MRLCHVQGPGIQGQSHPGPGAGPATAVELRRGNLQAPGRGERHFQTEHPYTSLIFFIL